MDPDLRRTDTQRYLKEAFTLISNEALAWYARDPEAIHLVTVANSFSNGALPANATELFVLLTLYRFAIEGPAVNPGRLRA